MEILMKHHETVTEVFKFYTTESPKRIFIIEMRPFEDEDGDYLLFLVRGPRFINEKFPDFIRFPLDKIHEYLCNRFNQEFESDMIGYKRKHLIKNEQLPRQKYLEKHFKESAKRRRR